MRRLLFIGIVWMGCGGSGGSDNPADGSIDIGLRDVMMDASERDVAVDGTLSRICVPISLVGTACGNTGDCDPSTFCESGRCVVRPSQGVACGDGVYCATGLGCSFDFMGGGGTMLCQPLPERGEACALTERGPFLCADGFGCVMRTCQDLPAEGEMCTVDSRCAGELGCDFRREGSFCAPRRSSGAACESDLICASGHYCDFSELLCTPHELEGATCTDGNECGDGSCVPDDRGAFRCVHLPAEGDACFFDCQPGFTCETQARVYRSTSRTDFRRTRHNR